MEAFRAMISQRELGVSSAAFMLHTSRSSFQYAGRPPSRRFRADEREKRRLIGSLAGGNITYGYRRIWALLRRRGVFISRNRVRRIMGEMHLLREAHFPRPRLPQTGNLVSDTPDTRWYTDITYIDTTDFGPCAFIEIEDACTREIIAWNFLVSCGAAEAFAVVEEAVMNRFPSGRADGLRLKTDGGSQFTSTTFREGCSLLGIKLEATRKRKPEDNGMIESLHGHFKNDYVFIRENMCFAETQLMLSQAVRHYNGERPHSSLGYLTPSELRKSLDEQVRREVIQ